MTLSRPSEVSRLIAELGIRPNRSLGQNFLIDGNILDIIVRAAEVRAGDRVLEIGPGLGAVTERLLSLGASVRAVEKDRVLHDHLRRHFAGSEMLSLVHADALDVPADELLAGIGKVVSNLPYSSGSRILVNMAQSPQRPRVIVVTVQKEVAARLAAGAGSGAYGLLGMWVRADYTASVVHVVRSTCFHPRPAVDSAVVKLERRESPLVADGIRSLFYSLTRRAFEHRRKKLPGTLEKYADAPACGEGWDVLLGKAGICADARPEEIAPEKWAELAALAAGVRGERP